MGRYPHPPQPGLSFQLLNLIPFIPESSLPLSASVLFLIELSLDRELYPCLFTIISPNNYAAPYQGLPFLMTSCVTVHVHVGV